MLLEISDLPKETLDAASSKQELWKSAQLKLHDKFKNRSQVQVHVLTEDIKMDNSKVTTNPQFSKGGANHHFIEDYKTKLKPNGSSKDLDSKVCR